ncbi:tyrosine-type recombinase/integrase [Thioclava sp.]|uniref:tyrosine-type recombinase/integrase n=1 Tax=Thioclava sp. TaxID=1933450 RepID=UPI003AA7C642
MHASKLDNLETIQALPERAAPYWNILEYCRHIGVEKKSNKFPQWVARIRKKDGRYKQSRLGLTVSMSSDDFTYEAAIKLARVWFAEEERKGVASTSYPVGTTQHLKYTKSITGFTVGDALIDYVEWKRIAATKTTFETLVALINFHILPRLGSVQLDDLKGVTITNFCRAVLETPPKRGNQTLGEKVKIESLDSDALRRRKGTLNTLLGILRIALQMAWENGHSASERSWRCIHRVPNLEVPRQIFLTRAQCRDLIAACRPDLADLVRAALYSGCRVSELSSLHVRDIGKDIFGIYVSSPKGWRPRYVYLPEEGMRFFLGMCAGKSEDDILFRTDAGQIWRTRHRHLFKAAVEKAHLPREFVFHGLRHTYASQLVQAGAPLAMVARQLGHSSTDTVSRTYGHLSCESVERELALRFASLEDQPHEYDARMRSLRKSLQAPPPTIPASSWPRSNFALCRGEELQFVSRRGA